MYKIILVSIAVTLLSGCQSMCNNFYPTKPEIQIVVKEVYPKIDIIPETVLMKCVRPVSPVVAFPQLVTDKENAVIPRKELMSFASNSYLVAYECFKVMEEVTKLQSTVKEINAKSENVQH